MHARTRFASVCERAGNALRHQSANVLRHAAPRAVVTCACAPRRATSAQHAVPRVITECANMYAMH
eukprot:8797218-Lingulodinium_polyedra.AAC.1